MDSFRFHVVELLKTSAAGALSLGPHPRMRRQQRVCRIDPSSKKCSKVSNILKCINYSVGHVKKA